MKYDQLWQKANNPKYVSDEIVQMCLSDIAEARFYDPYRLMPEYRYLLQNRIEQIDAYPNQEGNE